MSRFRLAIVFVVFFIFFDKWSLCACSMSLGTSITFAIIRESMKDEKRVDQVERKGKKTGDELCSQVPPRPTLATGNNSANHVVHPNHGPITAQSSPYRLMAMSGGS